MREANRVYLPCSHVAYRKIAGQMVLVETQEDRLLTLNETGSAIWELLDGRTVDEIAAEIHRLFEVEPKQALQDTIEFVETMEQRGLAYCRPDSASELE